MMAKITVVLAKQAQGYTLILPFTVDQSLSLAKRHLEEGFSLQLG